MVRRTVSLTQRIDTLIRDAAHPGESYSATVVRLIEAGARALGEGRAPGFIGIADDEGPDDLSRNVETYMRQILANREHG